MCDRCADLGIIPDPCPFEPIFVHAVIDDVANDMADPDAIYTQPNTAGFGDGGPSAFRGLETLKDDSVDIAPVDFSEFQFQASGETMRFSDASLVNKIKAVVSDATAELYQNFNPDPDPQPDPNPQPDPDPVTDPTTTANPRSTQSAPNLSGPLRSIDWGLAVADQLPNTSSHDIRVYFAPGGVSLRDGFESTLTTSWSNAERAAAVEAFEQIEAVADVNFIVVNNAENADFVMAEYRDAGSGDLGIFYLGDSNIRLGGTNLDVNGYGLFNNDGYGWNNAGLAQGGYAFLTLVHEIGHGMGLSHPHDDGGSSNIMNGVTSAFGDAGSNGLNQGVYTVMTYNDGWMDGPHGAAPADNYGFNGGMMALDIAVLQDTYGANSTTGSGNSVYVLPDANRAGTFYSAIWDTGGTDTIRYNGSRDALIDLTAATLDYSATGGGVVSYATGIHGGFTIANGVVIENATGGSGDDTLVGNAASNQFRGNAGADTFVFVEGGNDRIVDFADDIDTLVFRDVGGVGSVNAAMNAASTSGSNVIFDFGSDGSLQVNNITLNDIRDDISIA